MFITRVKAVFGPAGGPVKNRIGDETFEEDGTPVAYEIRHEEAEARDSGRGKEIPVPEDQDQPIIQDGPPYQSKPVNRLEIDLKETIGMGFLNRLAIEVKAKNVNFEMALNQLKQIFPTLKLHKSTPKEYVYYYKPADANAKLDIQKMKDVIAPKFPNLVWTYDNRGEEAQMAFDDGSTATLVIGEDDKHLTVYYVPIAPNAAPKDQEPEEPSVPEPETV